HRAGPPRCGHDACRCSQSGRLQGRWSAVRHREQLRLEPVLGWWRREGGRQGHTVLRLLRCPARTRRLASGVRAVCRRRRTDAPSLSNSVIESADASALPLVSVILPVRDEGRFIALTLDAVLAQDYPPGRTEIIVVDGMSTDGTREVVTGFAARH